MFVFFFNDTATTEIYTLSLHDALPIFRLVGATSYGEGCAREDRPGVYARLAEGSVKEFISGLVPEAYATPSPRSEEHTSELQSRQYLVCRLLLEKKKKT